MLTPAPTPETVDPIDAELAFRKHVNALQNQAADEIRIERAIQSDPAVRALNERAQSLASRVADLEAEISKLTDTNLELVSQADTLKSENAELHKLLGDEQAGRSTDRELMASLRGELSAAKDNLAAVDLGVVDRDKQITKLNEQLAAALKPKKG